MTASGADTPIPPSPASRPFLPVLAVAVLQEVSCRRLHVPLYRQGMKRIWVRSDALPEDLVSFT